MDAYRVSARIDGGAPHRRRTPSQDRTEPATPDVTPVDLVGQPIDAILAERWAAIRERWSQATFFLFDPDSWRS